MKVYFVTDQYIYKAPLNHLSGKAGCHQQVCVSEKAKVFKIICKSEKFMEAFQKFGDSPIFNQEIFDVDKYYR